MWSDSTLRTSKVFSKTIPDENLIESIPCYLSASPFDRRQFKNPNPRNRGKNTHPNHEKDIPSGCLRSTAPTATTIQTPSSITVTTTSASSFPTALGSRKTHKITSNKKNLALLLFAMFILTIFPQQQQRAAASPVESRSQTTWPESVPVTSSIALKTRLRKRHSSWREQYAREMSSREIEWANPCGGQWHRSSGASGGGDSTEMALYAHRIPFKKILRMLQNSTGKEHKTIKANTPIINISDISMWSLHKETYKFLPVLKINSNIALRRWHRQVQIFVASFAYLRRAQMTWDYAKLQHESAISKELLKLKHSARGILCEIETAINSTGSAQQRNKHKRHRHHHQQLNVLSRERIEKRLRFQTRLKDFPVFEGQYKLVLSHHHHRPNHHRRQTLKPRQPRRLQHHLHQLTTHEQTQSQQMQWSFDKDLPEVNSIDLKFAKYRYFGYLRAMLKILRSHTRRFSPMPRKQTSNSLESKIMTNNWSEENANRL